MRKTLFTGMIYTIAGYSEFKLPIRTCQVDVEGGREGGRGGEGRESMIKLHGKCYSNIMLA